MSLSLSLSLDTIADVEVAVDVIPAPLCRWQCLETWMDDMLSKVLAGATPEQLGAAGVKTVEEEDVLLVCLHEIARQVSVTCDERGKLLFRIRKYVPVVRSTVRYFTHTYLSDEERCYHEDAFGAVRASTGNSWTFQSACGESTLG